MNHLKNAWKSITIWFNAIAGALLGMGDMIKDNMPLLGQYLTAENMKNIVIGVIVINVLLRFRTNKSLADK